MFSLSVCMIVKNEEKVLDRILNCIKNFADEIIIVDTGSTDHTINIASRYTSNIFHFVWCDDFSKARNFSFSKATKDYIMWLDADDFISQENIKKIISLKNNESHSADVYMFKYLMGHKDGSHPLEFYRERIVKNNNTFNWSGFVHEVITPSGNIEYLDIVIEHRKEVFENPKRNLNLYRKAIKNGIKFSLRDQYYYSRELYYNNYLRKSEKELKKYLKLNDSYTPNILGAYLILSNIYLIQSNSKKGKNIIFKCLKKHTPTSELLINLAKFYEIDGNITNAIFTYHTCLACPRERNGFVNGDTFEFIPYIELSRLYYQSNNYNQAKYFHLKAEKIHPNHPSIIYNKQFFE